MTEDKTFKFGKLIKWINLAKKSRRQQWLVKAMNFLTEIKRTVFEITA